MAEKTLGLRARTESEFTSELVFHGSQRPGTQCLMRRHASLGGTDFEYVGSLPDAAVDALRSGGALWVRLREDAQPGQAYWSLDVVKDGQRFQGTLLSDDRLNILMRRRDRFAVHIEGGDLTWLKHDLLVARAELEQAESLVAMRKREIDRINAEISENLAAVPLRVVVDDGRYEVVRNPDGSGFATHYGARWRELEAGSLALRLAEALAKVREEIVAKGGDPLAHGPTPASYGPQRDLLRIALEDGTVLVQTAEGTVTGSRNGKPEPDLVGDKLVLNLAYDLEGARAALQSNLSLSVQAAEPDTTPAP